MYKPASLRQHLTSALPELQRDPEKLAISAVGGRMVSGGRASLSFEYQYTLRIILLDFAAHADAVAVPLLAWLRAHQPDLLDNAERRARDLRFEVDFLNSETVDLQIEVELTERVVVRPDQAAAGRLQALHPEEPRLPEDRPLAEHWELWLKDDLLASWDLPAQP